jgi:hypothetical protein
MAGSLTCAMFSPLNFGFFPNFLAISFGSKFAIRMLTHVWRYFREKLLRGFLAARLDLYVD